VKSSVQAMYDANVDVAVDDDDVANPGIVFIASA
jgi:hypothetical protein